MRDWLHDLGVPLIGAVMASPLGLLLLWGTCRLEAHLRATLGPAAFTEDLGANLLLFGRLLPFILLVPLAMYGLGLAWERRKQGGPHADA